MAAAYSLIISEGAWSFVNKYDPFNKGNSGSGC